MARKAKRGHQNTPNDRDATTLRIVGGKFRGRKLKYAGDTRVRPMKDRLREAIFNLVGPAIKNRLAIDLFAGTGAIGLEAISRGASRAILIERHFPTARVVQENIAILDCGNQVRLRSADSFVWSQTQMQSDLAEIDFDGPWVIFCSPPYAFFHERWDDMQGLIVRMIETAPTDSIVCVESETDFDPGLLPLPERWESRTYSPALVSILRKS